MKLFQYTDDPSTLAVGMKMIGRTGLFLLSKHHGCVLKLASGLRLTLADLGKYPNILTYIISIEVIEVVGTNFYLTLEEK